MNPRDLNKLFPRASKSFLALHGLADDPPVAPRLPDAEPERADGKEPLRDDEAQAGSPGRVVVCVTRYSTGRLDKDNLYGGTKALCDALRYGGYIRDDDPDSIILVVRQRKAAAASSKGTEVLIYPLEP